FALKHMGSAAQPALQPLLDALQTKGDEDLRRHCGDALANIGEPAVPKLIETMGDKNFAVQFPARTALKKIGKPAVPQLIQALQGDNRAIREGSMMVLGELGPDAKAAVPLLREITKEQDKVMADAARTALKKIEK
ncbi:MAG: HEAT repeat domain-containing protein, partial [Planctomycetia bacterium]|nr:HEAT repeat domain-containing protein [Planctomycetia bacterium]